MPRHADAALLPPCYAQMRAYAYARMLPDADAAAKDTRYAAARKRGAGAARAVPRA